MTSGVETFSLCFSFRPNTTAHLPMPCIFLQTPHQLENVLALALYSGRRVRQRPQRQSLDNRQRGHGLYDLVLGVCLVQWTLGRCHARWLRFFGRFDYGPSVNNWKITATMSGAVLWAEEGVFQVMSEGVFCSGRRLFTDDYSGSSSYSTSTSLPQTETFIVSLPFYDPVGC